MCNQIWWAEAQNNTFQKFEITNTSEKLLRTVKTHENESTYQHRSKTHGARWLLKLNDQFNHYSSKGFTNDIMFQI